MSLPVLLSSPKQGIVVLTLNRPEAFNALSIDLLNKLQEFIQSIQIDRTVRCVILTGAGSKAFCAGADLKERLQMDTASVRAAVTLIRGTVNAIESLPMPVIAAINGVAFGGGMELALACDLRIASEQAKLGLTETSLGIIPGAGGTQRLPRLIGKGRAKELIFTAKRLDAQSALEIGAVEYVTPQESVMDKAFEIAEQIVRNAPIAVAQAKFAIDKGTETDLITGLAIEQSAYEATIPTMDRLEGLDAFLAKRPPVFKGE